MSSTPHLSAEELTALTQQCGDPFKLVEEDIGTLSAAINDILGSNHPVLEAAAQYFFKIDGGKKIRPTMVIAMSYALNVIDNDDRVELHASPSQKRLAEITEMIHTASLFHDDVIDKAETRRGVPSVNQVFGNKLAILGGDFLLSRASVGLARLRNVEVVELLSAVIEHLVRGEIMQMRPGDTNMTPIDHYMRKNFYKTASLMGHSCMAAAVLGEYDDEMKRAAYLYGTYVGQAFQLIDDVLDFEGTTSSIGKAPLADLKSGLATAPTLFAAEEHPELLPMISRKFEGDGDIEAAVSLVMQSEALQRTKDLAQVHVELAIDAVQVLPPSAARDALVALAVKVVQRNK
jgi:solanesyl diphosphate synthase